MLMHIFFLILKGNFVWGFIKHVIAVGLLMTKNVWDIAVGLLMTKNVWDFES
jgi:hypothetical protein